MHLKQGYDLAAKDANGLSDPYVKFFLRGTNKAAHKSKTVYKDLNPVWDERFVIPVEDPFVPIDIKVGGYIVYGITNNNLAIAKQPANVLVLSIHLISKHRSFRRALI